MIHLGQSPPATSAHTSGATSSPIRAHPAALGAPPAAASLYLHIPFCFHKCHYCDFYSIVDNRDRQGVFLQRMVRELAALAPLAARPLRTIFVGGGTPTLLRVDLWGELLRALSEYYDLSEIRAGRGEFTVECNPETATPELMATLRAGGVNRVSVGAQSFDPRHLKTLERWHEPANVGRALQMARAAGIARTSLDLIFAIPGQTLEDWAADLQRGLELGAGHMSCYSLTYEPNTAMTRRMERGEFTPVDEDLEADMYELTVATLGAAGLHRYEVSNFARPGDESRHNLAYWRAEPWLAAGPSASAHIAGWRWKTIPRLDDYLHGDDNGFAPATDVEAPDPARALVERIMMGIRLREGLDRAAILREAETAAGADGARRLAREATALEAEGVLAPDPTRLRLADRGFLLADLAARRLAP